MTKREEEIITLNFGFIDHEFTPKKPKKKIINYKEVKEKIKSMSAYDIIMAMVEGLRNPKTEIEMGTFGEMREGVCFGCAATNAVLHIMNASEDEVKSHVMHIDYYDDSSLFRFEQAIDLLRRGRLDFYNTYACITGFSQINPIPGQKLPRLGNDYTDEQLKEYEKLAKHQLTI